MTLFQHPNISIIAAAISFLLFLVLPAPFDSILLITFIISLSIWSYGEMFKGVNWFRRSLGGIGFGVVAVALVALIT